MAEDAHMADATSTASQSQHTSRTVAEGELAEKYPNRPYNRSETLPFHELFLTLFNPLRDNRKKPTGPKLARKKQGPHGPRTDNPNEVRRTIIERFVSRWRKNVGNDIYPALRLVLPDKDRERAMYGLKEAAIAKLLVRIMKIDRDSEDAFNLRNWKSADVKSGSAGDFAARCFDALSKRPLRTSVGSLTVEDVNEMLDRLSIASKEEQQLPIMQEFYQRMNPEEMMWLIRIILRQMKIGATEKTILDIWHPDAETLFNVSSNLRRVCWELYDPHVRLEGDNTDVTLMQCFQPQLAQFQMHSFEKMLLRMRPTDVDKIFWVEEKLDGERMQMHMLSDPEHPGGKRFHFWSRKAKDYTYLYGNGFYDDNSGLTRHLRHAFNAGVENIILDGEMITWDPKLDRIVGFGTLKTAALEQQKDPYSMGHRPFYKVFDILYLNGRSLTKYTLRDRRAALKASLKDVERRMEIHQYVEATTTDEVENLLRKTIEESSEGLVVKSPRSSYHLNDRNDDWIKVKPEYMEEHGEAFDCVVVGGYYGSGHRGGNLSSFLCGLPVGKQDIRTGANPQKCYSFFKVGGGFTAIDYAELRHKTEGKWRDWNVKKPPNDWIVLAGGSRQFERPDVWIKPEDSVVLAVKAAQIGGSPQFATKLTLRFPRFKALRADKTWETALNFDEFHELKWRIEKTQDEKKFKVDDERRKRKRATTKREIAIAGEADIDAMPRFAPGSSTHVLDGLTLCIMTNSLRSDSKHEDTSKAQIEHLAKQHGAALTQSATATSSTICIADRETVSVSGLKKKGSKSIFRPSWLFDSIAQAELDIQLGRTPLLLPCEPRHVYFAKDGDEDLIGTGVHAVTGGIGIAADCYGDSFCKDISGVEEMRKLLMDMPAKFEHGNGADTKSFLDELEERGSTPGLSSVVSGIFKGFVVHFAAPGPDDEMDVDRTPDISAVAGLDIETTMAANIVAFAGGRVSHDLDDPDLTTVVMVSDDDGRVRDVRRRMSVRKKMPRIVALEWVTESWAEGTVLDEERFVPGA